MSFIDRNLKEMFNGPKTKKTAKKRVDIEPIYEINDTNTTIKPEINEIIEATPEITNRKSSYMVEWYKKNKEKHINTLKTKSKCDCGVDVAYGNRLRHLETPKHKNKMELITLQNQIKN